MKKALALLLNDVHISKDNISEFNKNWDEALKICAERSIKKIFVGGDLWQSRSAQNLEILMTVRDAIIKTTVMGIDIILEPGNHDKVDQESILSYSHLFSEYPGVTVVNEVHSEVLTDDVTIHFIAYFPESGSFKEKLNKIIIDESRKNILYCHQGIRGGLLRESASELPAKLFDKFDVTLVGHYHDRKKVEGHNIWYIGSSRQHNFGEDLDKGYTILYSDGTMDFVQNNANTRYQVINITDNMSAEKLEELKRLHENNNTKFKVKVHCKSTETSLYDKKRYLDMGISKVEFVTEQTKQLDIKPVDVSEKFSKETLKAEYVNFCDQQNIDDSELGLTYLDKINFNTIED